MALALFGLLVALAPAVAASMPALTRFPIEEISVEGARLLSSTTIVATSRLEPGRDYTESQLRDAAARLIRLALVLEADFALEKGSDRGRYRLVIRVEEARPWFFGLRTDHTWWSEDVSVDGLATTGRVDEPTLFVGRRFSIGNRGVAFATVSADDGELTAGYSRYELFGRGGLATVTVSSVRCDDVLRRVRESPSTPESHDAGTDVGTACTTERLDLLDPAASNWSAGDRSTRVRLSVGVPLVGNQSLRLRAEARRSDSGIRRPAVAPDVGTTFGFEDREDQSLDLSWVLDSTDDPIFPTTGLRLRAGGTLQHLEATLTPIQPHPSVAPRFEMESTVLGLSLGGQLHHPVSGRHSVTIGGRAFAGRRDADDVPVGRGPASSDRSTAWRLEASLGHSLLLYRHRPGTSWRELRWIGGLEVFDGSSFSPDGASAEFERGFRISGGLSLRTDWGIVSFRLAYVDRGGR